MSVLFDRHLKLEPITVEASSGELDPQGLPGYGEPAVIDARVVYEDVLVADRNGTETTTNLTVWVPAGQLPVPSDGDRVTYHERTYIVVNQKETKRLASGEVTHYRLRCKAE